MQMFMKNAAHHSRPLKEKHIDAIGRRPIGHGKARAITLHLPTQEDQAERSENDYFGKKPQRSRRYVGGVRVHREK